MTPSRRLEARRAYGRAVETFDAVAWKPPMAHRFDGRVANDHFEPMPSVMEELRALPGWVAIAGGGVFAALMGALLGGALHI